MGFCKFLELGIAIERNQIFENWKGETRKKIVIDKSSGKRPWSTKYFLVIPLYTYSFCADVKYSTIYSLIPNSGLMPDIPAKVLAQKFQFDSSFLKGLCENWH